MRFIRFCMRDRENGRRQAIVNETYQTNNNNKKKESVVADYFECFVFTFSQYQQHIYFIFLFRLFAFLQQRKKQLERRNVEDTQTQSTKQQSNHGNKAPQNHINLFLGNIFIITKFDIT